MSEKLLTVLFVTIISLSIAVPRTQALKREMVKRAKLNTALIVGLGGRSFGTCFRFDNWIVTNHHVIKTEDPDSIKIVLNSGYENETTVFATVEKISPENDLALLKCPTWKTSSHGIPKGDISELFETAEITAFGYPFGSALAADGRRYPTISVNMGRVSSIRRAHGLINAIQFDAQVNPGNSGGPALDEDGCVIGIVTSGVFTTGVNFAIPISRIVDFISGRIRSQKPEDKSTKIKERYKYLADKQIEIDGVIQDALLAAGGKKIVLVDRDNRRVHLFDTIKRELTNVINLPKRDAIVAASKRHIFFVNAQTKVIERWNLSSARFEKKSKLETPETPYQAVAGSASSEPLWLFTSKDKRDKLGCLIIDPLSLKEKPTTIVGSQYWSAAKGTHFRCSASGAVVGGWRTNCSPSGVFRFSISGNTITKGHKHDTAFHVIPTAKGRYLFTGSGIYSKSVQPMFDSKSFRFFPTTHEGICIRCNRANPGHPLKLTLCRTKDFAEIFTFPPLMELIQQQERYAEHDLLLDKRLFCIVQAKLLLTIPYSNDRLIIHDLPMKKIKKAFKAN